MTIIRVDPDLLKSQSSILFSVNSEITSVGKSIMSISASAPSYDGQFGPKVQAIAAEGYSISNRLSSSINAFSISLSDRASRFQIADTTASASLSASIIAPTSGQQKSWFTLAKEWLEGILGINKPSQQELALQNAAGLVDAQNKILPEGISTSSNSGRFFDPKFFTTVRITGPDTGYFRNGFDGKTESDCTWYAAEAVTKASNGKIDFTKTYWHAASEWAKNAENDIPEKVIGIDQIPQNGDVMVFTSGVSGHVAFVENVVLNPNGTYTLTISEESADATTTNSIRPDWRLEKNVREVSNDDRNLRWRKTFDLDLNDTGSSTVKFIHPNY